MKKLCGCVAILALFLAVGCGSKPRPAVDKSSENPSAAIGNQLPEALPEDPNAGNN